MNKDPRAVLGILAGLWAVLTVLCMIVVKSSVESDLTARGNKALTESVSKAWTVKFDGPEASIFGPAVSGIESQDVEASARNCIENLAPGLVKVSGIRRKSSTNPAVIARASSTHFRISHSEGQTVITGTFADGTERNEVGERLKDTFDPMTVTDRSSVNEELESPFDPIAFVKAQTWMKKVNTFDLSFSGGVVTLGGSVPNSAIRDQVMGVLRKSVPQNIKVINNLKLDSQIGGRIGESEFKTASAPLKATLPAEFSRGTDGLFEMGSSNLTDEGQNYAADLAAWLTANPDVYVELRVHTSKGKSPRTDTATCQARGDAILTALKDLGTADGQVSVRACGSKQPIAPRTTLEGQKKNRRFELEEKGHR